MGAAEFILNVKTTGTDQFAKASKEVEESLGKLHDGAFGFDKILGGWKGKLAAAFTAGVIFDWVKGLTEGAEKMEKLGFQVRASVDFLKSLKKGARETNTDFDGLVSTYQAFAETQAKLAAGVGRTTVLQKSLRLLGISESDSQLKNSERLFRELVTRMRDGAISAEQYAAGVKVLGDRFGELAYAAQNGLGAALKVTGPGDAAISNQNALTGLGGLLRGIGNKVAGTSNSWGATALNAVVTGTALAGGFGAKLLGGLPGAAGDFFNNWGDKTLLGAMESFIPVNEGRTKQLEQTEVDRRNARKSREDIGRLSRQIRDVLGDDADDVLEELSARSARREDYETALRRAVRQKKRQDKKEPRGTDIVPRGDRLSQLGLFVGGAALNSEGAKQTQTLTQIRGELVKVNGNLKSLKG